MTAVSRDPRASGGLWGHIHTHKLFFFNLRGDCYSFVLFAVPFQGNSPLSSSERLSLLPCW